MNKLWWKQEEPKVWTAASGSASGGSEHPSQIPYWRALSFWLTPFYISLSPYVGSLSIHLLDRPGWQIALDLIVPAIQIQRYINLWDDYDSGQWWLTRNGSGGPQGMEIMEWHLFRVHIGQTWHMVSENTSFSVREKRHSGAQCFPC